MCHWFSQTMLCFFARGPLAGRRWYLHWNANPDRPRYTLGAWLGRNKTRNEDWSVLSNAPIPGFEGATRFEGVHTLQPKSVPQYARTHGSPLKDKHPQTQQRWVITLDYRHMSCKADCGEVYHRLDLESDNHRTRWQR